MTKDFKHISYSESLWIGCKVPWKIVFYVSTGRSAIDGRPGVGQPQTTNQTRRLLLSVWFDWSATAIIYTLSVAIFRLLQSQGIVQLSGAQKA